MQQSLLLGFALLLTLTSFAQQNPSAQQTPMQTITKNGMTISWHYQGDRIFFEMSAPTDGWVAIGFNTSSDITGNYLLMGNVADGKASLVEHYTLSPGNYKPVETLGATPQVLNVEGTENDKQTVVTFSLPIKASSKYQRDLTPGQTYTMLIAYSREDDFQHHSMMRSAVEVKL